MGDWTESHCDHDEDRHRRERAGQLLSVWIRGHYRSNANCITGACPLWVHLRTLACSTVISTAFVDTDSRCYRRRVNRRELETALSTAGIRPDAYHLGGAEPHPLLDSEQLILEQTADGWSVWYSEKGLRSGEHHFQNEDAACRYVLSALMKDPTTRA
jgi:hypothetical protein